jgi:hypothetical protein
VIEAAVNGGPDLFRQAFIDPEYIHQNPGKYKQVVRLKNLLLDQLKGMCCCPCTKRDTNLKLGRESRDSTFF